MDYGECLTELMKAIINKDVNKAIQLIENDSSSCNECTELGVTPLMIASHEGAESIVKLLLEKGVDAAQEDNLGRTAIFFSIMAFPKMK